MIGNRMLIFEKKKKKKKKKEGEEKPVLTIADSLLGYDFENA